jgi:hypothetical protein
MYPQARGILPILIGITGFIPFLVHKIIIKKRSISTSLFPI